MASVAVPMVAGFVVNKVGESQGWDPRMTAILGAAAGFGAGGLVSGAASSAASSAAASSFNPGTIGAATNTFNPMTTGVMAGRSAASSLGSGMAFGSSATPGLTNPEWLGFDAPGGTPLQNSTQPNNPWQGFDAPQDYSKWESPHTMTEGFGKFVDKYKESGKLDALGISMLETLLQDPPKKSISGGGGGGGGGAMMPAYNGGGASQKAVTWGFGGQKGGYTPQGIA